MQFLRVKDQIIVNEAGEEVILTGYGTGNWMNQEGFLFGSSEFGGDFRPFMRAEGMDRGRSIHQTIIETCGSEYASGFWNRFYRAYFGKADIEHLASMGFNSVRLPLKAAAFMPEEPEVRFDEETFAMLDELIAWCGECGIYVILDMHAACSGQSAISCDDGVDNQPHLYTDEEGWERTILLWEEFARRYKDCEAVAGYELLNEPLALPAHDSYLPDLIRFYEETIRRIRAIDQRHIIFLQGHRFASRADIFSPDMDPGFGNWVLTVHMYETLPDLGLIGPVLAAREELGVPVWVGETGGSSSYMTVLYEMLREHHIGVNIWCHKAVHEADAATLLTYGTPEGFDRIRRYAREGGARPSYAESIRIFDQYIENVRFENCTRHEHRADAILRRPGVTIPATGYDVLPGEGESFHGKWPYCAFCGYRREDRMHFVHENGFVPYESAAFQWAGGGRPPKYGDWPHLELMLSEGEFAVYTIRNVNAAANLRFRYRNAENAVLEIEAGTVHAAICLPPSDGYEETEAVMIPQGEAVRVKIACSRGSAVLREITFGHAG